eukprot:198400-Amphidinium_carterae.2
MPNWVSVCRCKAKLKPIMQHQVANIPSNQAQVQDSITEDTCGKKDIVATDEETAVLTPSALQN